jgi:hypothetical protein
MEEHQEMDARNERALKRATIVEKWWRGKIKRAVKQSEVLRKEMEPGEVNEGKEEELRKMKRQKRLAIQRLSEREVQRERIPQEGGQEEECVEVREYKPGMDLVEEREDSTPIPGNIRSLIEEIAPEDENETPRSKKPTQKIVEPAPNHTSHECLLYQW